MLGSPLSLQGSDMYSSGTVAKLRGLIILAFLGTDIVLLCIKKFYSIYI